MRTEPNEAHLGTYELLSRIHDTGREAFVLHNNLTKKVFTGTVVTADIATEDESVNCLARWHPYETI